MVRKKSEYEYMKKKNSGFTLVELIVTMAILSILGTAVIGFFSVSASSYKTVSNDVDLQQEAQIAMNQIGTLLINAEKGVNYKYFGKKVTEAEEIPQDVEGIINSDGELTDEAVHVFKKDLYIYNETCRYVLSWVEEDKQLVYKKEERKKVDDKYVNEFIEIADDKAALLAENVEGFSVELDTSGKEVVVRFSLELKKGQRNYKTNQNFSLRNSAVVTNIADVNEIYDGPLIPPEPPTYKGIIVKVGNVSHTNETNEAVDVFLTGDTDYVAPISVTILGEHFPSQEYTAAVTGGTTDENGNYVSKVNDSGNLVISNLERSSTLHLYVSSKVEPDNCNLDITINVKKILDMEIECIADTHRDAKIDLTGPTAGFKVSFKVIGDTSSYTKEELAYEWKEVEGGNCTITGNILSISDSKDLVNQPFMIEAVSKKDDTIRFIYEGTIGAYDESIKIISGPTKVNRGSEGIKFSTNHKPEDIKWTVSVKDSSGKDAKEGAVIISDGELSVKSGTEYLDYNKPYTITIKAELKESSIEPAIWNVAVEPVAVKYSYDNDSNARLTNSYITVSEIKDKRIYFELEGLEHEAVSKVSLTNKVTVKDTTKESFVLSDSTTKGVKYVKLIINDKEINASNLSLEYYTNITYPEKNGKRYYIPVSRGKGTIQLDSSGTEATYKVEHNYFDHFYLTIVQNNIKYRYIVRWAEGILLDDSEWTFQQIITN